MCILHRTPVGQKRGTMPTELKSRTPSLLGLCAGYFAFYVATGVAVKYFLGPAQKGYPGFDDITYLVYSTIGGTLLCLAVVVLGKWYRLNDASPTALKIPKEVLILIPSGICTAVVIPTTTLMYTLPISVMVAMVIMRGAIIIVSRLVDAIQSYQGILKKKVSWEENLAVVVALLAVGLKIFWVGNDGKNHFAFLESRPAMIILGAYVFAYSIRIYLMNYFKNTGSLQKVDNRAFFGIEQIVASATLLIAGTLLYFTSWDLPQVQQFQKALATPPPSWSLAILSGTAFGMVAFFSVFIFMYRGRTATFAGLVNRLTSLIAGTASTLVVWAVFGGRLPSLEDWTSFGLILVAVALLYRAELKYRGQLKPVVLPGGRAAMPA